MRRTFFGVMIFLLVLSSACQRTVEPTNHDQTLDMVWIGDAYLETGSLDMQTFLMLTEGGQIKPNLSMQRWVSTAYTFGAGTIPAEIKKLVSEKPVDLVVLQAFSPGDVVEKQIFQKQAEEWVSFFESNQIDMVVFYPGRPSEQDETTYQTMVTMVLELAWAKKLTIAPVGDVWQRLLDEDPPMVLFADDQIHPSAVGVYLNAVVFYSVFTGKSALNHPVKLSIGFDQPDTIHIVEDETARKIQETAWEVIHSYQSLGEFSVVHELFLDE